MFRKRQQIIAVLLAVLLGLGTFIMLPATGARGGLPAFAQEQTVGDEESPGPEGLP